MQLFLNLQIYSTATTVLKSKALMLLTIFNTLVLVEQIGVSDLMYEEYELIDCSVGHKIQFI
jgi:hypothetical protein